MTAPKIDAPAPQVAASDPAAASDLRTVTDAAAAGLSVTEPGIWPDMDETTYHRDPVPGGSLSASGAKKILEAPAKYNHDRLNGQEHKDVFDFGTAAHAAVLGVGGRIVVLEFDNWRSKEAKQAQTDARLDGATPILAKDWAVVEAMATKLREHPIASALLAADSGRPEVSAFWHEDVWKRCRYDWLPDVGDTRLTRLVIPDYKTTTDASLRGFEKSIVNFGYHQQADWYLDGARVLLGADDAAFVFIAQEKTAPYLVNVIELSTELRTIGRQRNERAVHVYQRCMETGEWPGYPEVVHRAIAPTWATYQHEEDLSTWEAEQGNAA